MPFNPIPVERGGGVDSAPTLYFFLRGFKCFPLIAKSSSEFSKIYFADT